MGDNLIGWAAGVIEGEGCIVFEKIKTRTNSYRTSIAVSMTDKDVVEKLLTVLGVGTLRGPYQIKSGKSLWTWAVQNQKGCFETLLKVGPYLGDRRLKKASEMFEFLETKVDKWI